MASNKKRQKRVIGDIAKIDLGDGFHTYARVLEDPSFAFYDARVTGDLPINQIIELPILFYLPVTKAAIQGGAWMVIGSAPLDDATLNPPPTFMQDALNKDAFEIYENGDVRPATKDECVGLERTAVWSPCHVEDRLRDHYAGRKNIWVESLRMKE
jgi:Immunity protein 26